MIPDRNTSYMKVDRKREPKGGLFYFFLFEALWLCLYKVYQSFRSIIGKRSKMIIFVTLLPLFTRAIIARNWFKPKLKQSLLIQSCPIFWSTLYNRTAATAAALSHFESFQTTVFPRRPEWRLFEIKLNFLLEIVRKKSTFFTVNVFQKRLQRSGKPGKPYLPHFAVLFWPALYIRIPYTMKAGKGHHVDVKVRQFFRNTSSDREKGFSTL
jgi:hypothetical protein